MTTWEEIGDICANLDFAIAKVQVQISENWSASNVEDLREQLGYLQAARKSLSQYKSFRSKSERLARVRGESK